MRNWLKLTCFGLLAGSSVLTWAAEDVDFDAQPVFRGGNPNNTPTAMDVTADSRVTEPNAWLTIRTEFGSTRHPVSLRAGERTVVRTYLKSYSSQLNFKLEGKRLNIDALGFIPYEPSEQVIAVITNQPSSWSFLRGDQTINTNGGYRSNPAATCSPKNAPDRAIGYHGFGSVVLAQGAETLTDAQVSALQGYALLGGQIIACAKVSDSVLKDKRWAPLLQVGQYRMRPLRSGEKMGPKFELTTGTEVAERPESGKMLGLKVQRLGEGKVSFCGFNPTDKPTAANTGAFLNEANVHDGSHSVDTDAVAEMIGQASTQWRDTQSTRPGAATEEDPFQTKLPKPGNVIGLLAGFFFVVIPVNFLVLRLFRRTEWVWFTAPIVSIIFTLSLFSLTKSLYSAKQASSIRGRIVAQEGVDTSMFIGRSELFFPQSGTFDLKAPAMDGLLFPRYGRSFQAGRNNTLEITPVDNGSLTLPEVKAPNLAFRELDFTQKFTSTPWIAFKATFKPKRMILTAKNLSPYLLRGAAIELQSGSWQFGDIKPGEQVELKEYVPAHPPKTNPPVTSTMKTAPSANVAKLTALVEGLRPGPAVGKLVEKRSFVELQAYSKPLRETL